MQLSIIIVNYRSRQYLDDCLASIRVQGDLQNKEVIVVNNDTEDDLKTIQEKYSIQLYNLKKNVGFGSACNYGAKKAKGEIILFLNPDTKFLDDFDKKIVNRFEEGSADIGIIGPKLLNSDGKIQAWCAGKDLTIKQRVKNHLGIVDSKKIWESKRSVLADWVSGASLAIKRNAFEKLSGFDENFFMYSEDLDLCFRARSLGYAVVYCPEIAILHKGGKSRESLLKQKIQFFKSSLYYIKKKAN